MIDIQGILNIVRRECQRLLSVQAKPRIGIIDSYDPDLYCAKVRLQPENTLTGFLPITTEFVGNGWGLVCGPSAGDVVDVHFQEWGKNAGYIGKRFYSTKTKPPGPVPSGEVWLVHKSGSFFKVTNDGKMSLNTANDLDATVGADMNATVNGSTNLSSVGDVTMTTPNLVVNGNIIATGDITDLSGSTKESMQTMRARYNAHTHGGVEGGGGTTETPLPEM